LVVHLDSLLVRMPRFTTVAKAWLVHKFSIA